MSNPPSNTPINIAIHDVESVPKSSYDADKFQDHLLEQYKLYIASVEQNSSRRNLANSFFLSLHLGLIAGLAAFYKPSEFRYESWLLIPWLILIISCYFWYRLIQSYKQLNTGKFLVIAELEKFLPVAPWVKAEWKALGEGKNPKMYIPITHLELWVPIFFSIAYISLPLVFFIESRWPSFKLALSVVVICLFGGLTYYVYHKEHKA